ncbi:hypothetical protein ACFLS4_03245 [Bacteroidota bacterium]
MFNSTILEVVIGLVFLYLLFSLLATFVNEIISTFFRFRATQLKKAIKNIMDNDAEEGKILFDKFHKHPLIQSFVKKKGKGFPSYIEPKKFANVIVDIYNEDKISKTKDEIKETISKLPEHNYLRSILLKYIEKGEDKAEELQKNVEDWFNSVMERTSGWYNRYIKVWTLAIAFAIALLFNFDSIDVYQRLSKDSKVRKELVKYAEDHIDTYAEYLEKDTSLDADSLLLEKMDSLKNEVDVIINEEIASIEQMAGIGWEPGEFSKVFKNYWSKSFLLRFLGWVITAMAISLGAPFWFDLLNKIMKLRGTGIKQELANKSNKKEDKQILINLNN